MSGNSGHPLYSKTSSNLVNLQYLLNSRLLNFCFYFKFMSHKSNYNKHPFVRIEGEEIFSGWNQIIERLQQEKAGSGKRRVILAVETYQGVYHDELTEAFSRLSPDLFLRTENLFKPEEEIRKLTWPDVTDDTVFGYMTRLTMTNFLDENKVEDARVQIDSTNGLILIYGYGASFVSEADILVWADMARWEIQLRMRRNEVNNLGVINYSDPFSEKYKRGFFVDWRVCDRVKKQFFHRVDFVLDTNKKGNPKMISGAAFKKSLGQTSGQPFRLVPFFDPGPWGGQWMKEYCELDKDAVNYAWCFDCVPEENSLLFEINGEIFETPSINLVFFHSEELLGAKVEARFGKEFPIRFDFLDTMDGGNLSFQVHPETSYIQEHFGMHYTQDESYYLLDAREDATVFLGLKKNINPDAMIQALTEAQDGEKPFDASRFINQFPARKHDHFLIPAGTVHCSGKNSMVLEISSTPYIFTFKMWDWGRNGLDGKPRPINLRHGINNIRWERDTDYVSNQLVNRIEPVAGGEGWREERTGLHPNEFIETRRHWFSKPVVHNTNGGVNVLNLVEGSEAIVESPTGKFQPMVVHYAETFVIPASVGKYIIRPYGTSEGKEIATLKAYVR